MSESSLNRKLIRKESNLSIANGQSPTSYNKLDRGVEGLAGRDRDLRRARKGKIGKEY